MRLLKILATASAVAMLSVASLPVLADSFPDLETNRLNRPSDTIGTIGNGLFGEQVDLYNGQTSFDVTDISIPGNNRLPVSLGRHLDVVEADQYGGLPSFENWEIDVPYISGYFAEIGWKVGPNASSNRCSVTDVASATPSTVTKGGTIFVASEYWSGNSLHVPGAGSQEMLLANTTGTATPVPTDGNAYYWTTKNNWVFSCLSSVTGDTGEGFLATSPDGTKYYFDRMITINANADTEVKKPWTYKSLSGWVTVMETYFRQKNVLLASHVVDRFGNTVTYRYDSNNHLGSITSSDGRGIYLTWTGGLISSASDGVHTWTYKYTSYTPLQYGDNHNNYQLTSVVLPDSSKWSYQYAGNLVMTDTSPPAPGDPPFAPTCGGPPLGYVRALPNPSFTVTATHPSGTTGVFQFKPLIRGRSYVANKCTGADPATPKETEQFAIYSKTLSGPGLPTLANGSPADVWTYSYLPQNPGGNSPTPYGSSWAADCTTAAPCPTTVTTEVNNPDGTDVLSSFGNMYELTEGQLQDTTVFSDSTDTTVLDDVKSTYWGSSATQSFPQFVGTSPYPKGSTFMSEELHPEVTRVQYRDGVWFSSGVNTSASDGGFDLYAHPTNHTLASTLNYSRTDTTAYDNNTNLWVLGQVKTITNSNTGLQTLAKTYDPTTAMLTSISVDGLLKGTLTPTYVAGTPLLTDGTIGAVTDGDGASHTTTFSNYYRGEPQLVVFADGTSKSAVVDGYGHITSLTDETGYATGFGYDAMGRLTTITPPANDTQADGSAISWTPTNISFVQSTGAEYGLPAGHWKQTVATGGATKITYFDSLWQPVLTREFDASNAAATTRFDSKAFDFDGRTTFASYPVASVTNYNDALTGVHTTYDGIGRTLISSQDSEQGPLNTKYSYLSGFVTQVTNPRGYSTSTSYQAFDGPDTSHPVSIASPLNVSTTITRDVFGKPLTLTRNGTWGANNLSETRSYVYDANQRLCARIEPETGTTLLDYDGADNLLWSVSGSTQTTCSSGPAPANAITRTYDLRNRPLTETVPGSTNIGYSYFADGALKTLTSGTNTWTYAYDKRRLPMTEQLAIDGRSETITHTYNSLGIENRLTYPSGLAISPTPNALGQPTNLAGYATAISYFPNGGMSGFTYGNGIVHTLTQNARELPLESKDALGSNVILDDTYSYDANANVSAIADGTSGNANNRTMTYDFLDRLLTASAPHQPWISAATNYDGLDNIRNSQVGSRTNYYSYDSTWRLSQITGGSAFTFGYDTNGNVASKGAGKDSYTFDLANRLQSVTGKESYVYDGYGRRVKITNLSTGKIDYPVYAMDGQLLTEDDQRTGLTTDYVNLNGSLVGKRYATIGKTNWVSKFEHTDALHSPITETDSTGTATHIERYTPYGEPADGTYTQGPGFTGHVTDAATGLTYAQQRYYDPVVGRFLSVDPVLASDNGANFNRYWYANNNPYRFTDKDGRLPWGEIGKDLFTLIPEVGDAENIAEAVENPTAANVAIATLGLIPEGGAFVGRMYKAAKAERMAASAAEGAAREVKSAKLLAESNPAASVQGQRTLLTADGKRALDPVTNSGRRVDHSVIENGTATNYETTSLTANKTAQAAKEDRILKNGGTFVRDKETKELVPVNGQSETIRHQ